MPAGLEHRSVAALAALGYRRLHSPRHWPARLGDPATCVLVVLEGAAARVLTQPSGEEVMIELLTPGTIMADALGSPAEWSSDVVPLGKVSLSAVPVDVAMTRLAVDPALALVIASQAEQSRRQLAVALAERSTLCAQARVFAQLLRFSEALRPCGAANPAIPLTQSMLASAAGATRQTTNSILSSAVRAGLVETPRGAVRVLNTPGLRRMVLAAAEH